MKYNSGVHYSNRNTKKCGSYLFACGLLEPKKGGQLHSIKDPMLTGCFHSHTQNYTHVLDLGILAQFYNPLSKLLGAHVFGTQPFVLHNEAYFSRKTA